MTAELYINDCKWKGIIEPDATLLEFLRSNGYYSVKQGCDSCSCGICTVWVDGFPVLSCKYPACRAAGKRITTIEGTGSSANLLGMYLSAEGAEQCGYCSPGLIMTVLALEKENPDASEEEVETYLAGNLCRCSGYQLQTAGILKYLRRKNNE